MQMPKLLQNKKTLYALLALLALLAVCAFIVVSNIGGSGYSPTEVAPPRTSLAAYTQFVVRQAIARYEAEGLEATLEHYNDADSLDGQWSVFIIDGNDKLIGHYNPDRRGGDIKGILGTDINGYKFGPQILAATEEGHWVSYFDANPTLEPLDEEGALQLKNGWIVRHDGLFFGSGWFIDAEQFAPQLIEESAEHFRAGGLEALQAFYGDPQGISAGLKPAAEYYNSTDVLGGLFTGVVAGPDGKIQLHIDPALLGTDIEDLLGPAVRNATEAGGWFTAGDNPDGVGPETMRVWAIDVDGTLIGAGLVFQELASSTRLPALGYQSVAMKKHYEREVAVAKQLAAEAGKIMLHYFGSADSRPRLKSDRTIVTKADTDINRLVIERLAAETPGYSVHGEEESRDVAGAEYTWVCDPVDGTMPFAKSIPISTFSLALVNREGRSVVGIVHDPFQQRLYEAVSGGGAFLNGQKIDVSSTAGLENAFVDMELWINHGEGVTFDDPRDRLNKAGAKVTTLCSAVIAGCFVAQGTYEAMLFGQSKPEDIAALAVIVTEAGGRVTDLFGDEQRYDRKIKGAVVSNDLIHQPLLAITRQMNYVSGS